MTNTHPQEGPNGVDRWTSNGYGLTFNGKDVESPAEKEESHGNEAEEDEADER